MSRGMKFQNVVNRLKMGIDLDIDTMITYRVMNNKTGAEKSKERLYKKYLAIATLTFEEIKPYYNWEVDICNRFGFGNGG